MTTGRINQVTVHPRLTAIATSLSEEKENGRVFITSVAFELAAGHIQMLPSPDGYKHFASISGLELLVPRSHKSQVSFSRSRGQRSSP